MASYPAINDREFDLLKKICNNTADLSTEIASDVSSITGTANQIVASQATGAVTLSLASDAYFTTSLLVGLGSAGTAASGVGLEVTTTSTSSPRGIMTSQYSTSTDGARLHMRKARGTRAAPTTVVTGDNLGRIVGTGYDGSNYLEMASIIFGTEGTIAATRVPTNIQFWTATNAAPSVLTLGMSINSSQQILGINGSGATPTWSFSNDTGSGLFLASSTQHYLGIALNGVAAGRLESNGSGGIYYENGNGSSWLGLSSTGAIDLVSGGTNQSITLTPSGTGFVIATKSGDSQQLQLRRTTSGAGSGYLGADSGNALMVWAATPDTTNNRLLSLTTTGNLLLGGASNGTGQLQFLSTAGNNTAGIAFTPPSGTVVYLYSGGSATLNLTGALTATGALNGLSLGVGNAGVNINAVGGNGFNVSNGGYLICTGSGVWHLSDSPDTSGVCFDVHTTNGTLKVKNLANNADGSITCASLTLSGTLQLGNAYVAGVVTATGTVDIKDSLGTTYHVLVKT